MIGKLDAIALDCPDPRALAGFYAEILGLSIAEDSEDEWVELTGPGSADGDRPVLAFQKVDDYRAPEWPGQLVPQQLHLDIRVDSLDEGERAVLALGATATGEQYATWRVYLDPVGHPFCLVSSNG